MSLLQFQGLSFSYAADTLPILSEISLNVAPGQISALIGNNGCGKSTLLKVAMGFLTPSQGQVLLDGKPVDRHKRRHLARKIAYLPQENHCPDYITLAELVEMGGYARQGFWGGASADDREKFAASLAAVGLDGMGHMQVSALSGGQRQRAWIAMILAQDADIILLDEPINHLDLKYQMAVLELLRMLSKEHGRTIITVLHDLNHVAHFADESILMQQGRILASGAVARTMTEDTIEQVFGVRADVFIRNQRLVCLPANEKCQDGLVI